MIYISKPWHRRFKWNLLACSVWSHYLVQCWIIVNWTLGNKFYWNLNENGQFEFQWMKEFNEFRNVVCKMKAIFSWPQGVDDGDKLSPACPVVWCRDHFVYAPSQCSIISHWLGAYTEWSLFGVCRKRSLHKINLWIIGVEIKSTLVMMDYFRKHIHQLCHWSSYPGITYE